MPMKHGAALMVADLRPISQKRHVCRLYKESGIVEVNMQSIMCGKCGASWAAPEMFSDQLRHKVASWVRAGKHIIATQEILSDAALPLHDANAIVIHITKTPGTCHRCGYPLVGEPTAHCPFCQALNYDW